jgi:hypothetical protein
MKICLCVCTVNIQRNYHEKQFVKSNSKAPSWQSIFNNLFVINIPSPLPKCGAVPYFPTSPGRRDPIAPVDALTRTSAIVALLVFVQMAMVHGTTCELWHTRFTQKLSLFMQDTGLHRAHAIALNIA